MATVTQVNFEQFAYFFKYSNTVLVTAVIYSNICTISKEVSDLRNKITDFSHKKTSPKTQ